MEVLFIRHGETDGNRAWRHQHTDTRLNERGKAQVQQLLKKIEAFAPTHLVTSTNLRAVETAREIATATGHIPDTSALFEELRRPTMVVGRRFVSLETVRYIVGWFYGAKMGDGETYAEFMSRLEAARRYLEALPQDARVAVVSHSVFINMFIEHRCRPKRLSLPQAMWRFFHILRHKNTGLSLLRFHPPKEGARVCTWHVEKLKRYERLPLESN